MPWPPGAGGDPDQVHWMGRVIEGGDFACYAEGPAGSPGSGGRRFVHLYTVSTPSGHDLHRAAARW